MANHLCSIEHENPSPNEGPRVGGTVCWSDGSTNSPKADLSGIEWVYTFWRFHAALIPWKNNQPKMGFTARCQVCIQFVCYIYLHLSHKITTSCRYFSINHYKKPECLGPWFFDPNGVLFAHPKTSWQGKWKETAHAPDAWKARLLE